MPARGCRRPWGEPRRKRGIGVLGSNVRVGIRAVRNVGGATVEKFGVAGPAGAGAIRDGFVLVSFGRAGGAVRDVSLERFARFYVDFMPRFRVVTFRVGRVGGEAGERGDGLT